MPIKCLLINIVFIFIFYRNYAQAPSSLILSNELIHQIEILKTDPQLENASWGISVLSLKSGKTIAEHNSTIALVPASTLKIVTTGAALGILGADYTFLTHLEYDGFIDDKGVLQGNLYIKGGGDPSLGSAYFQEENGHLLPVEKWAKIIHQNGIKSIKGAIIADASVFQENIIPSTWIWADIGNYYGAGACGLSYIDNKYSIYFNSGKENEPAIITRVSPEIPGLNIVNRVVSKGKGDNAFIYGAPYTEYRYISGSIPSEKKNFEVRGSIPDPAWFCAYSLEKALNKIGIKTTLPPSTLMMLKEQNSVSDLSRTSFYSAKSPPLDKIVYWTNLKSNNHYAEHLLKAIAFEENGKGTDTAGIRSIQNYWGAKGIILKGMHMADGSGLSRLNSITTRQQVEMLRIIYEQKYYMAFYNSLAVAGRTGSIASLCKGTAAENNLRAKSGYIERVRAYTGYVSTRGAEQLAFSILINNYDGSAIDIKKKIEKLMIAMANLP